MKFKHVRLQEYIRTLGGLKTDFTYWDGSNDSIENSLDNAICWFLEYNKLGIVYIRTIGERCVVIYYMEQQQ